MQVLGSGCGGRPMVAGEDIRCVGGVELSGISWVIITPFLDTKL